MCVWWSTKHFVWLAQTILPELKCMCVVNVEIYNRCGKAKWHLYIVLECPRCPRVYIAGSVGQSSVLGCRLLWLSPIARAGQYQKCCSGLAKILWWLYQKTCVCEFSGHVSVGVFFWVWPGTRTKMHWPSSLSSTSFTSPGFPCQSDRIAFVCFILLLLFWLDWESMW